MRRLALALGSLALSTLASAPALAQSVQVGGQISVGIPQIVVPVPAAPAAPPPVYVYSDAPPPPPGYYAPQAYYQPPPRFRTLAPAYYGVGKLGLDLHVDGAMGFNSAEGHGVYGGGGAGLGLRYHATPHFGLELGVDFLGGRDWESRKTTTVAGNMGGLIYFNPRSRAQVYLSGGLLVDHTSVGGQGDASVSGAKGSENDFSTIDGTAFTHVGGYAGMGLELFVTRRLTFHLDVRGVVRQNVSGGAAEFTDPSTGNTTNTSGGLVSQAGLIFYF
jgi:Outer membrane protein beta-barrel domain